MYTLFGAWGWKVLWFKGTMLLTECRGESDNVSMGYTNTVAGRAGKKRNRKTVAHRAWRKRKSAKHLATIREHKERSGCFFCGERFGPALHLHHVNPSQKKGRNDSAARAVTSSRVQKYLSTCLVVCATCHIKLHKGFFGASIQKHLEEEIARRTAPSNQIRLFPVDAKADSA
jgi:hypothetical protein